MAHEHHGHDHAAPHAHAHVHAVSTAGRAFLIGLGLNLAFVAIEAAFGVAARSMALLADAGHNLGDVLGLALSSGAAFLARRKPSERRTYGLGKSTILAAFGNAGLLLVVTGGVAWESIRRLTAPEPVVASTVIVISIVGVVVNGLCALLFLRDRHRDLNVRSAFLHLASDAALSLAVAVSGVVVLATGWQRLDPIMSLFVSATILLGTWSLLRQSLDLALDAVPEGVDPEAVRAYLAALPDVVEVHDLHIWGMSTTETALTAHLITRSGACAPAFLGEVCHELHERFGIGHSTLQVEGSDQPAECRLAPADVV